jgi:DNA-binding protein H-NS
LPSLSSLLLKIPDEFKPMAAIGIGSLILVLLVLFHGFGLHRILVSYKRSELRLRLERPHLGRAGFLFGSAVFLMLSMHIAEIVLWAYSLIWLGLILRPTDAIYFCANAYTTLGYGTVDLGPHWRNISPIVAISGLFTFAWTTSVLVRIVADYLKLIEQLEVERAQELNMRAAARTAEHGVLKSETEAIKAHRLQAEERSQGQSFSERRAIRKEEKLEEKQIHDSAKAELQQIRDKERHDEDMLGQTTPQNDPEVKK